MWGDSEAPWGSLRGRLVATAVSSGVQYALAMRERRVIKYEPFARDTLDDSEDRL